MVSVLAVPQFGQVIVELSSGVRSDIVIAEPEQNRADQ